MLRVRLPSHSEDFPTSIGQMVVINHMNVSYCHDKAFKGIYANSPLADRIIMWFIFIYSILEIIIRSQWRLQQSKLNIQTIRYTDDIKMMKYKMADNGISAHRLCPSVYYDREGVCSVERKYSKWHGCKKIHYVIRSRSIGMHMTKTSLRIELDRW